ncbi:MAG: glycerol kinase GlpK [Chloroflexi bacterium]|nr:MAG: glycerol kinase GlpK [Chloroflexota bacterium]
MILALDQGTTGSVAVVVDDDGRVVASVDREIAQHYPQPGWVEHDPEEVFRTTVDVGREAIARAGVAPSTIAAIGITNQRETTVVWERATGRPVHPAVVWQSRASAPVCESLRRAGREALFRERTGLTIDAYFSATKIRFILDRIPDGQRRADAGELLFGTIDTWLLWRLSNGTVHATDTTNASRTLLFDIRRGRWDDDLLRALDVPRVMLPDVQPSSGRFAEAGPEHFGAPLRISGVAGDQHAALLGQACTRAGEAKNTYGTGCFLLANTGADLRRADGLLTTIAIDLGSSRSYALEGSAFVTGAAVQWLRDGLGVIADAAETEALAASLPGNDGVYLVPAFVGLGAPHWDMYARGLLIGISRGTTRAHLARATLESIAYQTRDLVEAMRRAGQPLSALRVDGGGTANRFLMQFQADLLGVPVEVAAVREMTALGAAYLAGLAVGVWKGADDLRALRRGAERFEPRMSRDEGDGLYARWLQAVERAKGWEPSVAEPGPAS